MFSQVSGEVLKLTGRAIDVAREAYRGAVAQMQRLTIRKDADIEADAREAIEEKALVEDAERKAGEAAAAEGDLALERVRNQELEKQLSIRQNDQKLVAQERARTQALEQQLAARADEQRLLAEERAAPSSSSSWRLARRAELRPGTCSHPGTRAAAVGSRGRAEIAGPGTCPHPGARAAAGGSPE